MTDPVEPVDLTGDPEAAARHLDALDQDMRRSVDPVADLLKCQQDTDDALNDLAERIEAMEADQAAALATTRRTNRLYTFMAAGALLALGLFLLVEKVSRRAAP